MGMRVVIIGATGNAGPALLDTLASEQYVDEVVAVARRAPSRSWPRTRFTAADIT